MQVRSSRTASTRALADRHDPHRLQSYLVWLGPTSPHYIETRNISEHRSDLHSIRIVLLLCVLDHPYDRRQCSLTERKSSDLVFQDGLERVLIYSRLVLVLVRYRPPINLNLPSTSHQTTHLQSPTAFLNSTLLSSCPTPHTPRTPQFRHLCTVDSGMCWTGWTAPSRHLSPYSRYVCSTPKSEWPN
jgi:hypothetical protein